MKIKIVSVKKFIRSILIALVILVGFSFVMSNKIFSHGDVKYKTIYISSGDTLWKIAKEEQNTNSYFEGKDIRDIVSSLKIINNLNTGNLTVGNKLQIPVL